MTWDRGWTGVLVAVALLSLGSARARSTPTKNGSSDVESSIDYRLPINVRPSAYDIMLSPDGSSPDFKGVVKITAVVVLETDKIVLHAGNISIKSINVFKTERQPIKVTGRTYDPVTEKLTVEVEEKLTNQSVFIIGIEYRGRMRDDMVGFYRSSYFDAEGEKKWLSATQFHAVHARHVFPCFDEPSFKAIFIVRILRPPHYRCLSNMQLEKSTETANGQYWDTFSNSVVMPTYLVAFVVFDFSRVNNSAGNFSVWARPNAIEQAEYALEIGPRALNLLSEIFDEPYQIQKMDMVALPDFFAFGAMENWGLITYRESQLLYDEKESSVLSKQKITSVIVHESTHMWFGNLVTPRWWSYLWLSEAFARYYQYFATAKLQPSWKMEQQFVVDQLQAVFADDAVDSSSPMTRNVSSQNEIAATLDTITYAKGASVVRMMDLAFGSKILLAGLRQYLKKNKFSSAVPEDLWSLLQHQVDANRLQLSESVATMMDTWTRQPGFPVLSVNIANGVFTLQQKRFLLRNPKSVATNSTWWIPVTWTTQKNPDFASTTPRLWFGSESVKVTMNASDVGEWVIFNVQQAGYYRVNYDKDSWYRIINVLTSDNFKDIHEVNRAAVVDDLMNLARAGHLDYDTALTGLNYVKRETNYLPIKAAFAALDYLNKRFDQLPNYHYISNFSVSIVDYIYSELGYDDKPTDEGFDALLRRELNIWACKFDHPECVAKALTSFNNWRDKSEPVPKNQREAVYCTAIRHGTSDDWNFLWKKYSKSNHAAEKTLILKSLGCSRNSTILEKYLMLALMEFDESGIRRQDSEEVFSAVYRSGVLGATNVLTFVKNHHATMAKYYGGYDTVAKILSSASQRISSEHEFQILLTIVTDFEKAGLNPVLESLKSTLALVQYELQWLKSNEEAIIAWMKKNNKGEPTTLPPPTTPDAPDTSNTTDYRLPTSILPTSYDIKLTPHIEPGTFTFDGIVKITAAVTEATDKIVMHINEIKCSGVVVTVDGKHVALKGYDDKTNKYDFLTITLNETLKIGATLVVQIIYTGKLNSAMKGFYRSSYVNDAGETKWLAATHLEPVGARKMFPCFDEPALKATFVVSVNRPAKYNAISNTPRKSTTPEVNGRIWDTFEETPKMSTYLVALIVSDFESLDDKANNCSVWARPNGIQQAKYALSVMAPLVQFFEKAVGHDYQLPKLDMAALPDFSSGAMENWGLLTYRESNMLYDKDNSPITSKQAIANVISHEISHQWFGDEVSPRWWKYLWLSEGFARYFQYYGTANVETTWGLQSQFVVEQLHSAFASDSLPSTHPMSHDVYSPSEISGIFDSISYAKSASVLRMVEKVFGSKLFYEALHDYIAARSYDDATPEHLYEAFQSKVDSAGVKLDAPVKTLMDTWTTQGGYPVVSVSVANGVASLSQKRYLRTNPDGLPIDSVWWIPLTWASKSKPDFVTTAPKYWLSKQEDSVKLNVSDEWVIFNVQQSGYYRVNYDSVSWNRIIDVLKSKDFEVIHEVNRAALLDDLLNLGRTGHVDYGTVLSATQYLSKETNYIPWRAAFNGLGFLNAQLNGTYVYKLYRTHILTILLPMYEKLGHKEIDTEPHYDKLLRRYLVSWACDFNVEKCISSSLRYFADWKTNPSKIVPVNIRGTVYCTAIKHGSVDDWEFLWKQYLSANVTTEKQTILNALGCSNNAELLHKLLLSAITEGSKIRLQDSTSVFSAVYSSSLLGAEYALDFVERYYAEMYDYYGEYSKIGSILSGVASRFMTKELVVKFETFVETHKANLSEIESSLQSYVTRAREELKWHDKYTPRIFEWLDTNYPSEDYRLPAKIKPIDYDIYLTPYLDEGNFTFDGEIRINTQVSESTSSVVLQADELTIKKIIVYVDSVNPLVVSNHTLNATTQKLTIYFDKEVRPGSKLSVYIAYTGVLNDKMKGFYRSSYIDASGKTRWLASTHFEPVYARRAFPCFDEPAFKATFKIHIERPTEYQTLSNMPRSVSVPSDKPDRMWDTYEETKLMSSYLIAFVVSDFKSLKNENGNFSVWTRPDAVEHSAYALSVGQKVLSFLERFTGIEYPIKKMDLIAVPDTTFGAMENWGLITFRESGLIYNENETSATYKNFVNTIVSHELVHNWFGNLVTCDWWDHVWLHEGFAQYFQWIASNFTEPSWNPLQQFVVYELQRAMQADGSPTIHPMNNNVTKPALIIDSFDAIAYQKSASVIRMMHHALGPAVFEPALRTYLQENKYGNAHPDDLWSAIQKHEDTGRSLGDLNVTVKTIMDSWANQAGYPVVNATWSSGVLTLSQQRFLFSEPKKPSNLSANDFWIPITITTKTASNFKNATPAFWFGSKKLDWPLSLKSDEWFVLNVQETGYYRVNYDAKSWKRLIGALQTENFGGIHEINRAQIIDDLLNLARTDYLPYDVALQATEYLAKETNHLPWKAFFNAVAFLNQRFDGHPVGQDFADYALGLTQVIYEQTVAAGNKTTVQMEELNRQLIHTWTCKLKHSGCVETAKLAFDAWRNDEKKRIPPNERPAVYCTAIKQGSYEDWEFLWSEYEKTNFNSEKIVILKALGCSRNTSTLNGFLKRAFSADNAIREHDVSTAFSSVYDADKFGVDAALDFLVTNYKELHQHYDSWSKVGNLFSKVAGKISTQEQIDKLESFVNKTTTELAEISSSLRSSVDVAKENLQWYNLHYENIRKWLSKAPTEPPGTGGGGGGDGNSAGVIMTYSLCLVLVTYYFVVLF